MEGCETAECAISPSHNPQVGLSMGLSLILLEKIRADCSCAPHPPTTVPGFNRLEHLDFYRVSSPQAGLPSGTSFLFSYSLGAVPSI